MNPCEYQTATTQCTEPAIGVLVTTKGSRRYCAHHRDTLKHEIGYLDLDPTIGTDYHPPTTDDAATDNTPPTQPQHNPKLCVIATCHHPATHRGYCAEHLHGIWRPFSADRTSGTVSDPAICLGCGHPDFWHLASPHIVLAENETVDRPCNVLGCGCVDLAVPDSEGDLSAAEFAAAYAARSDVPLEWLVDQGQVVVPCECEDESCEGWAMVSREQVMWVRERIPSGWLGGTNYGVIAWPVAGLLSPWEHVSASPPSDEQAEEDEPAPPAADYAERSAQLISTLDAVSTNPLLLCANCGHPVRDHCSAHLIPCCPGTCPGAGVLKHPDALHFQPPEPHASGAPLGAVVQPPEDVDHPAHYGGADDPYEAIKVIEALDLGFHLGNTYKYMVRAGKKPGVSESRDLAAARWYLDRYIDFRGRQEP